MYTILVVDDEKDIVSALEIYLKAEGYRVLTAYNGREALSVAAREDVHLILMDIMMPVMDGLTAMAQLRQTSNVPVILLTAKGEDTDKVLGLNVGADDYITKPFNPLELVARVKTQLRRYTRYNVTETPAAEEISIRGLSIFKSSHKCTVNGKELSLTPLEFNILWHLCEHQGTVVSSEELFAAVWGEAYLDSNNTVMTHIARLREKLMEPARKPKYIKTVWGAGYRLQGV